jgi:hypothetical protein
MAAEHARRRRELGNGAVSEERTPVRERYDAYVGLAETRDRGPYAFVVAKFTYRVDRFGALNPASPEPLLNDFNDETLKPRLRAGSDFGDSKVATDVVVQGSAFRSLGGGNQTTVSVSVGAFTKRVAVFGRRFIEFDPTGYPRITDPEPFDEIPLTYENAYGGIDWRTPLPEGMSDLEAFFELGHDHPGMYPRNPHGKGYLVVPDPIEGMEMPNLEDPSDLLRPDRLITYDARFWYRQPLPWCFDWMHPVVFPRLVFIADDVDAWYPGPQDDKMPEVRRAFLMPNYRDAMSHRMLEQGPDPRYYQEASLGMVFPGVAGGEPIRVTGMDPEQSGLELRLPRPIPIDIQIDASRERVETRIHHVVCRPAERVVTVTYGASRDLPRRFVPGIHKTIPVGTSIDGDELLVYETPPTIRDVLAAARRAGT